MKIYLKLYFWFVLIFVLTLLIVSLLVSSFYGSRVHAELEDQLISNARFVLSEYQDSCQSWQSASCREFLERLNHVRALRFWIVDRKGRVLFSNDHLPPNLTEQELSRAVSGETITTFIRRGPPKIVLPVKTDGTVEELFIVQRSFIQGRRLPRFPLLFSLIIAGVVIAVLVLPLSLRLTRPIRRLHQLGRHWAEGELDKRAALEGADEISDLAGVFNTMAENLEKMLQQRKEFLALISHELKSPLARMRIGLELLRDQKGDPQKTLKDLETEIEESEALIEQLLLVSRLEMVPPQMLDQPLDLAMLIRKSVEQVEPLAKEAQIVIHSDIRDATTRGDALQLQRALTNILENAIKFSGKAKDIYVVLHWQNGVLSIDCKDEGIGVPDQEREKIFEPFYRGKSAGNQNGTGLGLFIARRIVEMHKGKIQALPNHPSGTIIRIELPSGP